jgi:glycosyltransferase involved in cell wall biosynthesis
MATPRNILVITYWSYADALVQTYTLPYLRIMARQLPAGSTIHLVTLEKPGMEGAPPPGMPWLVHHPFPYKPFGAAGMGMILGLVRKLRGVVRKARIDTIHAWCTPAGMIGHILSVLTGRPLVIDSYEPHAEAMVENGTWKRGGIAHRMLFRFERLQSRRARVLIAAAAGMEDYARIKYGVTGKPFFVKPACVDLERFSPALAKDPELLRTLGLEGKLVAVYAGKFGGIYLDQEVFDLLRVARDHWGERFHVLLLTGSRPEELLPFMQRAGLDPGMFTIRMVPHADVPRHMGLADIALTPVRSVPTKRYCTPIKDGEYWALGLPVIITPHISDDSDIIERHGIGAVLEGTNADAYRKAVLRMDALLAEDEGERRRRIRAVAENYRHFRIAEEVYRKVYGSA